jgi:hypothetical protein
MDFEARQRLVEEVTAQQADGREIAVPLDMFFDGNDDPGSIGCNLGDQQPPIREFYGALSSLRNRPEVQDICIRICDASDESSWPYTDTVYVLSSLPRSEIEAALELLKFDKVVDGWVYGKPMAAPEPKPNFLPYSVWWD